MKNETKFALIRNEVIEVVDLGNEWYVPPQSLFKVNVINVFNTKEEANYEKALKQIIDGKPYTNFKVSKYYNYYLERLQAEHPELLI